jgi:hypothetical protein
LNSSAEERFSLPGTRHSAGVKVRTAVLLSKCSQIYTVEPRVISGIPCLSFSEQGFEQF